MAGPGGGNLYTLFIAESFLGTFQGFLLVLGVPLAAWAAVFLVDLASPRRDASGEPAPASDG